MKPSAVSAASLSCFAFVLLVALAPAAETSEPSSATGVKTPPPGTFMALVWEERVKPKRADDYQRLLREKLVPAMEKLRHRMTVDVFETILGEEHRYTILMYPMVLVSPGISLTDWFTAGYGKEEGEELAQRYRECLHSSTSRVVLFRPELGRRFTGPGMPAPTPAPERGSSPPAP